jgi:acyl CoA:acetate/3-ketoacid CoA transferase alpha subunit
LQGDVALIRAETADRAGNLIYRHTARNYNPVMATAAKWVIAEVARIVDNGALDPDRVETPGIYVDVLVTR